MTHETTHETPAAEFAGHTPGPWKTQRNDAKTYNIAADNDSAGLVAHVYSKGQSGANTWQAAANASLIAAAPDLLAERNTLAAHVAELRKALRGCRDALTEAGKEAGSRNALATRPNLYELHAQAASAALAQTAQEGGQG